MAVVAPVALFASAILVYGRLYSENELVVAFASGMSVWKIAEPLVRLASVVALFVLTIGTFVQPFTYRLMREKIFAIRSDIATTLVKEGQFRESVKGVTIYTRKIDQNGALRGLLISDTRNKDKSVIVVGGHLDSWDVGEGAHDDGAGIVQSIEILRTFKKLGIKNNSNQITIRKYTLTLNKGYKVISKYSKTTTEDANTITSVITKTDTIPYIIKNKPNMLLTCSFLPSALYLHIYLIIVLPNPKFNNDKYPTIEFDKLYKPYSA